jgi:hypothetical protein
MNLRETGCEDVNLTEQGQGSMTMVIWFWIPRQYTELLNSYRLLKEESIPWSE